MTVSEGWLEMRTFHVWNGCLPLAVKPSFRRLDRLAPPWRPKGSKAHFLASGREPVGAAARGRPILDAGQLPSAPSSVQNRAHHSTLAYES
jgi:hypothetical protein